MFSLIARTYLVETILGAWDQSPSCLPSPLVHSRFLCPCPSQRSKAIQPPQNGDYPGDEKGGSPLISCCEKIGGERCEKSEGAAALDHLPLLCKLRDSEKTPHVMALQLSMTESETPKQNAKCGEITRWPKCLNARQTGSGRGPADETNRREE